jgi:hypothetical protein
MLARLILVLAALALVAPQPALAGHGKEDPQGIVTDDPLVPEDPLLGLDGAGYSHVEQFLGGQPPANRADRKARNISLVGALKGAKFNQGVFGDVAGYNNLAFVGKWRGACPGTGVDLIDISRPAAPREIGFWAGAGAPANAPAVNIWSVVPHGDLLLASDRNFGLYILKEVPPK